MPAEHTIESERAAPWMLLYSLLFALVYVLCAHTVGWLLLTFARQPGPLSFLSHLIVVAAAPVPGWVFAIRHRRHFTPQERRRIVALCISCFEDGNLIQLCTAVITEFYAHPTSEPIELIFEGFQWDPVAKVSTRDPVLVSR